MRKDKREKTSQGVATDDAESNSATLSSTSSAAKESIRSLQLVLFLSDLAVPFFIFFPISLSPFFSSFTARLKTPSPGTDDEEIEDPFSSRCDIQQSTSFFFSLSLSLCCLLPSLPSPSVFLLSFLHSRMMKKLKSPFSSLLQIITPDTAVILVLSFPFSFLSVFSFPLCKRHTEIDGMFLPLSSFSPKSCLCG